MAKKTKITSSKSVTSPSASAVYAFSAIVIVISVCVYFISNTLTAATTKIAASHADWYSDPMFEVAMSEMECDFESIDISDMNFELMPDQPYIIKNGLNKWPALKRWNRHNFTSLFGDKVVLSGSESSIVFGGGMATQPTTIREMLNQMEAQSKLYLVNNTSSNATTAASGTYDSFIFDVSIMKSIPELGKDFSPPNIFKKWDNRMNVKQGYVWHMLSLGASRVGLPFHTHGESWLGLVHGKKVWFIYPPGYGPPAAIERNYNPMSTVYSWISDVYSILSLLPPPPLSSSSSTISIDTTGYRPLQCVQSPGDIMYVPKGYSHMTINIGETIGIGGQLAFDATDRLQYGRNALLQSNNDNFEGHKAVALSLAHIALDIEKRIKSKLKVASSGEVELTVSNFNELVVDTDDIWLVRYHSKKMIMYTATAAQSTTMNEKGIEVLEMWSKVANNFRNIISVGSVDIDHMKSNDERTELLQEHHVSKSSFIASNGIIIKMYFSSGSSNGSSSISSIDTLSSGITYTGSTDYNSIVSFINENIERYQANSSDAGEAVLEGSASSVGVRAKRMFLEAIEHLVQCVAQQPYHPEARGLLGEITGHTGDFNLMRKYIGEAIDFYDNMDSTKISLYSLSSLYHRLGTIYLMHNFGHEAIVLFNRSLQYYDYVPSLVDTAIAHFVNKEYYLLKDSLGKVELFAPNHQIIQKLSKFIPI